jgi:hypothetical protein
MARRLFRAVAGAGMIAVAGFGGCGKGGVLDPGAKPPRADGAVAGVTRAGTGVAVWCR